MSKTLDELFTQLGKEVESWASDREAELKILADKTGQEIRGMTREALTDVGSKLHKLATALEEAGKSGPGV
jgi:hypothetical protein